MTGHRLAADYATAAALLALSGVVAIAIGLVTDAGETAVGVALTAIVAAAIFWFAIFRPQVQKILRELSPAPAALEVAPGTFSPPDLRDVGIVVVIVALTFLSPAVSGLLFGMAAANVGRLLRVRSWERGAARTAVRVGTAPNARYVAA
ncbi:MAG TPA: hypothetical protein VN238_17440 [Solirubrobacteraceae bacterium]|nr:hypothetical protein [Solirubrobacteraceae bacterium]